MSKFEKRTYGEPTIQSNSDEDCISRKAVLDALNKWDWQELYLPAHFKGMIDDLPSIQPKPKTDVLDKIRAEIADLDDADYDYEGYYKAVTDALKIIDKYTAESEDKE